MRRVAVIVEGKGDVKCIPSLISKTAKHFDQQVFACEPPIKAGEAKKLRRPGELERFLKLAASREDAEEVILVVDLDDGCPAEYAAEFNGRAAPIAKDTGKPIHICFCVREYESWFLAVIDILRLSAPEFGIREGCSFPRASKIRAAKEALSEVCVGRKYKQIRDQLALTKKIDIGALYNRDRSFRKFVKSVTSCEYSALGEQLDANPT